MMGRGTAWVVGTFDTKGDELCYVAQCLREAGVPVTTVDIGTTASDARADIGAAEVAGCHPAGAGAVGKAGDRGRAVIAMGEGLQRLVTQRLADGGIGGMIGVGGSGGSSMIAPALHSLPIGMPKLLVSTLAAGQVGHLVGHHDVTLMYPVTDIAGMNRLSHTILANAAHALAGMMRFPVASWPDTRPALALTMFGVTTAGVQALRALLQDNYDCQVFHANGMGGRTMEALARAGMLQAIVDITTTEVGQHLAGGVCDAGPDRLAAAAELGLPWVGSVGALDMINWGPMETVPTVHRERLLHVHNAQVTLMRATAAELSLAGRQLAERLNASPGPVHLMLPLEGLSALDAPGQPFHDPQADAALFDSIRKYFVDTDRHRLTACPLHINDPAFAWVVAEAVREMLG